METGDKHSLKIKSTRLVLKKLALEWHQRAEITHKERQAIVWLADNAELKEWRPILYIVPRAPVANRIVDVPINKLANPLHPEYIIADLKESEFEAVELP